MTNLPIFIVVVIVSAVFCLITLGLIASRDMKRISLIRGNFNNELHDAFRDCQTFSDDLVSHEQILEQIDNLAEVVRSRKPDFLAGVHTGGRLLSALIAEKVGMRSSSVMYFGTDRNRSKKLEWKKPQSLNFLGGSLVIIDDISRRGNTLASIKDEIIKQAANNDAWFNSVFFATLLVSTSEKSKFRRGYFLPDWFGIACNNFSQVLPWSSLSSEVTSAYSERSQNREHDQYFIDVHERLLEDYQFAVRCAVLAVDDVGEFRRRVSERTILET